MTPEQQEALDTFVGITGETQDQAKKVLSENNWDLQSATDFHFSSTQKEKVTAKTQAHSLGEIKRNEPKKATEEW
jgi:hypothetical protein